MSPEGALWPVEVTWEAAAMRTVAAPMLSAGDLPAAITRLLCIEGAGDEEVRPGLSAGERRRFGAGVDCWRSVFDTGSFLQDMSFVVSSRRALNGFAHDPFLLLPLMNCCYERGIHLAPLDQLRQALERAGAGHGQVGAVVGEPGVGKSRLCSARRITAPRIQHRYPVSHGYIPRLFHSGSERDQVMRSEAGVAGGARTQRAARRRAALCIASSSLGRN
jgi:hypothetical protein